jgi:hypothetical protein
VTGIRDEFLSEEDLDLRNLSQDELIAYWNLWLQQAQATNDLDEALYSHGVFEREPAVVAAARVDDPDTWGITAPSPEPSRDR